MLNVLPKQESIVLALKTISHILPFMYRPNELKINQTFLVLETNGIFSHSSIQTLKIITIIRAIMQNTGIFTQIIWPCYLKAKLRFILLLDGSERSIQNILRYSRTLSAVKVSQTVDNALEISEKKKNEGKFTVKGRFSSQIQGWIIRSLFVLCWISEFKSVFWGGWILINFFFFFTFTEKSVLIFVWYRVWRSFRWRWR